MNFFTSPVTIKNNPSGDLMFLLKLLKRYNYENVMPWPGNAIPTCCSGMVH